MNGSTATDGVTRYLINIIFNDSITYSLCKCTW